MNSEDKLVQGALKRIHQKIDEMLWKEVKSIKHDSPEEEETTFKLCQDHFWKNYEIYTEVVEADMKMLFKIRSRVITRSDVKDLIGENKLEDIEKIILGESDGNEEG